MATNSTARIKRGNPDLQNTDANAIRVLAMDAVQTAKSGHPGAPMGMAEMAVALWQRHLRHNPANPLWPERDRFVLSNGHASMLLYALLHLTGYDLPMGELKRFRQLHSKTPGHPEVDVTPGVETTTGPLGQGLANAVGMALAERQLANEFNRPSHTIVDHHTYVFLGDGCLMEGISHEACSLAGTLGLNKLICLYDANGISIDGDIQHWFADDTVGRFKAHGWTVIGPLDGHHVDALSDAIGQARRSTDKPVLIICNTTIGAGSPSRAGTAKAHGEPLGSDDIKVARMALEWPHPPFEIPSEVRASWNACERGTAIEHEWKTRFDAYREAFPQLADQYLQRMANHLPDNAAEIFAELRQQAHLIDAMATRKASQLALAHLGPALPALFGGSADLTGSNLTHFDGAEPLRRNQPGGRHLSYGVREFGMAATMNGIALHGGLIPYGGTFLTFSDYSRNAIRMAALMRRRVIHVFTHDSIGLGEDGPTHQSVEHAASLRLIPNLDVWRPCDARETAEAWIHALQQTDRPSALLLSRQSVPALARDTTTQQAIALGGYVLSDRDAARAVLLATGSEVALALAAQKLLDQQNIPVRVVSLPCTNLFDRQPQDYRDQVLTTGLPRIGIEAGVTTFWGHYGCARSLGIDGFGESAPAADLFDHFELTAERASATVIELLSTQNT